MQGRDDHSFFIHLTHDTNVGPLPVLFYKIIPCMDSPIND